MRKLTLLITMLFLSVGMAWAQTNSNGPLVTFTNVQKNGAEFVLYITDSGVLDFSTKSAAELGEAAQFRATKQSDGKWTFYNESKELYMIWRGNDSGYNNNTGVLGSYNATYCNWTVTSSSTLSGAYRFASKRSNGSSDGTIVILSDGSRFDKYGDSDGYENEYSNQFRIDVVDHFGFKPAKDYASINNWYYLTLNKYYLYNDGTSNEMYASKNAVDTDDKDAYTWAFIGNPFDGYKVANKKGGYLNCTDNGAIVGDDEHTFTLTVSTYHSPNGFFMAGEGKQRFNRNGGTGKLVYWSGADGGSTFNVVFRDDAADLQALIDNAEATLQNLGEGTTVGYVTADSKNNISEAISDAETAIQNGSGYDAAEAALKAAVSSVNTIQPEVGKYYTINSEYYKNDGTGEPIGLDVNVNKLIFNRNFNVSKWFQFVDAGNGQFYLYNVKSSLYLSSNGGHNSGQVSASATTTADAKAVTITNMGKDNIVKIVPVGGAMIHAQAGGNVVAWDNEASNSASAWTIVEVENPGVAYIDNTNYATLQAAIEAWTEGKTINLLANTDETVVLPKDMKLDVINFNGFTASNVKETDPVAKIGEQVYYTFEDALAAAQADETITLVADVTCAEKPVFNNGGVVNVDINGHKFVSSEKACVRCIASADGKFASNNIKFVRGFGWEAYYNADEKFRVFPTLDEAVAYKSGTNAANIYPYENVVQNDDVVLSTAEGTASRICSDRGYDITWDLNGYTVEQKTASGNPLEATINGKFTLDDTSEAKTGKWIAGGCNTTSDPWNGGGGPAFIVVGDGELLLKGGTVSIARNTDANGNAIVNNNLVQINAGKLIVDGATLQCEDTYGIAAWGGNVFVNSGKFNIGSNNQHSILAVAYQADGYAGSCSVEVNTAIDGYMAVYSGATATVNAAGVKYVADGTNTIAPAVGEGLVAQGGVVGYPVAKIGETAYLTLEAAVAAATEGATITMLGDVTEDVTLPAGVTFNGNGKTVNGEVWAAGNLTFVGHTKATNFNAGYNKPVITIGEGACLELTGTGRMVIGHGATFNITGSIEDAKTADVATLAPSLIIPGASFTGAGVTFNVTNAYIKATAYCSSKNNNANGTFNFNVTNSVWEQGNTLVFSAPTNGMDPTFNLNLVKSVLNSTSHLVFAVTKGEIVIDNSNVNVGTSRQIENQSTMTIKNGSVVNGAVATSSNAKNPGTLIVENATYAVTGEFSGSDLGTGNIIFKKGASFTAGSITKANITIDATGMEPGEVAITAKLDKLAGELKVINNDLFEAAVVDGKIVLRSKSLAGEGTEDAPFVIENLDDLRLFAMSVNAGNDYAGKYVKLGASVDLSAQAVALMSTEVTPNWEPIGTKDAPFKGTFDGNGETISNMIVVGEANQGFFGYADAATIKNLNLVNVTVTGTDCVGAVAGQVYSVSLIDNCHVSGNIKVEGQTNVGGITGKYYTKVSNCSVIGDGAETSYVKGVYVASDFEGDNIGGIMGHCGENNNLAGNTVKNITISGTRKVGGIVGIADQNTDVTGCVVENVVVETTATADYADSKVTSMSIAALIGQYQAAGSNPDGTVTGCTVKNVTFNNVNDVTVDVGPIVGGARGGSSGMLAPSTAVTASGNNVYMTTITGSTNDYLMVAVAKIGEKNYYVLDEAFAAAQAGETVTLVNNVALETPVVISGKALTLDLGAYTIEDKSTAVLTDEDDVWALIDLENGANLTVCGTGTIKANYANVQGGWTGMAYCINVDKTSKLTVDGGNFINGNGGVQTRGEVVVNGGTFVSHNGGTCIMAIYTDAKVTVNGGTFKDSVEESDAYTGSGAVWAGFGAKIEIKGGTFDFAADPEHGNVVWTLFPAQNAIAGYGVNAEMAVSGGTFVNFNPAEDVIVDYSPSTGFTFGSVVAEGYTVVANADGTYSVADAAIEVTDAEGNVTYIANTKGFNTSNVTLKLMKDVAGYNLNLNKATGVVFDLNGYTFAKQINLNNGAELTIKDTSAEKTGKVIVNQEINDTYAAVVIMRGTLTVEGGTIETTGTTGAIQATHATLNIKGGKFVSQGNGIELGTWTLAGRNLPSAVTMTGGEIVAEGYGIKDSDNHEGTTIAITGGEIKSKEDCIYINRGTAVVSGGTFSKAVAQEYCAEGYVCKANGDGTYSVVEAPATGKISYRAYINDSESREAVQVDLENVYARNSLVVKLFDAEGNALTTTTLKQGGVEAAAYTCNIVLWGTASGSWDTEIHAEKLTVANYPQKGELWIDGNLVDTFDGILGKVTDAAAYQLPAYLALDCVYKEAKVGETYYATLADAVAAAEGETVTMLADVELTESLVIAAGKEVVLDLNGKTVSQSKECTASYAMITNNGSLTITGNGKLSFTDTSAGDPSFGWGSYTINNCGTLVVENGTIEHLGTQAFAKHMICAIFQYSGSTTINGGTISTPNYRSARLWHGDMTINGGEFDGQLWVQAVDNSAKLTINGGTFAPNGGDASSVFVGNVDSQDRLYNVEFAVTDGTFTTKIGCSNAAEIAGDGIKGGKFTESAMNNTNSALLAEGFVFSGEAVDGYYGIVADPSYIAELVIDDAKGENYTNDTEKTVGTLTYKRTLVNGKWNALYLPFEVELTDELLANYDFADYNQMISHDTNGDRVPDSFEMELFIYTSGTLEANYPYFVRPKNEEACSMNLVLTDATLYPANEISLVTSSVKNTFKLSGTYKAMGAEELAGKYAISIDGDWSYTSALKPYRLYFTITDNNGAFVTSVASKSVRIVVRGEDGTTGVEEITGENGEEMIFDLQGRRVLEPEKGGLYIKNGKKVMVK